MRARAVEKIRTKVLVDSAWQDVDRVDTDRPQTETTGSLSVPFQQPWLGIREELAVVTALRQGHLAGNGPHGRRVEVRLCHLSKTRHALLMNSGTAALEAALTCLGVSGGGVILPSFAFASTAAAVSRSGARPVFVDIESEQLGLDPTAVERSIRPDIRAFIHVTYGGFSGALEEIQHLARRHRVPLIVDAAHALGASLHGRPLTGWGTVACLSFHATKMTTCGEGGALVTNDDQLAKVAARYREYGTDRSAFFRGEVDHYEWLGLGSSNLLAEPLAAVLNVQLERLPEGLVRQRAIAERYRHALAPLVKAGRLRLPVEPAATQVNWHTFYVLMRDRADADGLIRALAACGIDARRHFFPLHLSAAGRALGYVQGALPVTESVAARLVRLPIYPTLMRTQQAHVIKTVQRVISSGGYPVDGHRPGG